MATDVVDAQIEAYRAKDVERFLSCYADGASVGGGVAWRSGMFPGIPS